MDIIIVGAGPTGTHLSALLAKQHEVTLLEEHPSIGKPVQCTGILTDTVKEFLTRTQLKSITQAVVKKTVVHSPNEEVELSIRPDHIIDNVKHCQLAAELAQDRGAKVLTNHRYIENTAREVRVKDVKNNTSTSLRTDMLVGADGPNSMVAKNNGLFTKRRFLTGVQAVVKVNEYDEHIHFYPHIGEYAWYCPEGEGRARIGVAAPNNARGLFDEFIKKFPGKVEQMQGGPIPLHQPRTPVHGKVINGKDKLPVQLIGDAALQIKNTTGGGIIPGMRAAHAFAKNPLGYHRSLGALHKELGVHYYLNKAMNKFTDKDWDKLVVQAHDKRVERVLKNTNRDHAITIAAQLLLHKPSMALWGRKLLSKQ
jgi:digeranylgeranylglycerophospholipid reductase